MGRLSEQKNPSSSDFWEVSHAASRLTNQACTVSARHIDDGILRLQFNREVAYYARSIVNDVEQGRKSPEQGLKEIKREQRNLLDQSREIVAKGAGVIAGVVQVATGAGICYASVGTLCILAGAPLMAHGANNIYENGRNILESRTNTEGPLRKGYQGAAKRFGFGEREGNIAYGSAELVLAAYSAFRLVLKPDAWRLFRYIREDYVRSYKQMGAAAVGFEAYINFLTAKQIHQEVDR